MRKNARPGRPFRALRHEEERDGASFREAGFQVRRHGRRRRTWRKVRSPSLIEHSASCAP